MRIAELSIRTGVSIPTIKYYIREGLLPTGEREAANQAQYAERHVHRLRIIRALIDVSRLSIASARALLACLDEADRSAHTVLGKAQYAITPPRQHLDDDALGYARDRVDELLQRRGWTATSANPALQSLVEVMATMRRLQLDEFIALLDLYAAAAIQVAVAEIEAIRDRPDIDSLTEAAILGTVLGDVLLNALRRLAQEQVSRTIFE
jgi:DNA-binding transcriptional MerR regulator